MSDEAIHLKASRVEDVAKRSFKEVAAFLESVRYIVFDLNGTLVGENYLKPDEVLEGIFKCRRRGRGMTVEDLGEVARGKSPLSEVIARLYVVDDPEALSRRYLNFQSSRIVFRGKALEVIKALREKYRLILCTDTTGIAKEVVKKLDLPRYFVKIFYSSDLGYVKSEEIFWTIILSHFPEAKPQEFLVVGDNPRSDIYPPNRLGMHTIQIENPVKLALDYREASTNSDEEKPEYFIKEPEEIPSLLDL